MADRHPLGGRVAFVAGASRGTGRTIALALADAGASVFVIGRTREDLEVTVRQLRERGVASAGQVADVGRWTEVEAAVRACVDRLGGVQIAVNNAALIRREPFMEMSAESWESTIRTNLTGVFHVSRAVAPLMAASGGGTIVSIASGAAYRGYPGLAAYCASKFGLRGLHDALGEELATYNVRMCLLAPGTIRSGPPRPGRKALRPEDVAQAVVMLATQPDTAWTAEMTLWPWREL